ncbi:MAG: hypothetical protein P4L16_07415 [Chlamydiales bacterium]|nr:hypothetical protein [Chlamydiales bacterium]
MSGKVSSGSVSQYPPQPYSSQQAAKKTEKQGAVSSHVPFAALNSHTHYHPSTVKPMMASSGSTSTGFDVAHSVSTAKEVVAAAVAFTELHELSHMEKEGKATWRERVTKGVVPVAEIGLVGVAIGGAILGAPLAVTVATVALSAVSIVKGVFQIAHWASSEGEPPLSAGERIHKYWVELRSLESEIKGLCKFIQEFPDLVMLFAAYIKKDGDTIAKWPLEKSSENSLVSLQVRCACRKHQMNEIILFINSHEAINTCVRKHWCSPGESWSQFCHRWGHDVASEPEKEMDMGEVMSLLLQSQFEPLKPLKDGPVH